MRSRFASAGIALALTAASALTLAQAPATESSSRTPEQVVRHHFAAAAARDLDAVVSDYADDAVLITANGVVRGKDAVRAAFAQLMRPPRPGARIAAARAERAGPQIVVSHFTRDVAWLMWTQNAGKPNEVRGVETYLVRAGRIELETVGTVAVHPASAALSKP
ncbi:MAG TPA: nuclear transport factor 2 family protein [Steroidobacteraceae bacterium]|nr:nuclear transport factor 2 family protein [Steroidobacteraceae bacterium]